MTSMKARVFEAEVVVVLGFGQHARRRKGEGRHSNQVRILFAVERTALE